MRKATTLLIISSILLIGCSEPEVEPNKQAKKIDNLIENEVFDFKGGISNKGYESESIITKKKYINYGGFNIKENLDNEKVVEILKRNNTSEMRLIKAEYNKSGELMSLVFDDMGKEDQYLIYGSENYAYEHFCKGDKKICEDLKKQGESLKPEYEQFLKDYDITTKELKEYFQYKYDKYVQDNPEH